MGFIEKSSLKRSEALLKEFLTIDELSEYLNLKRSTLYSMVENEELPHYRIGRLIRFKRDDVETWMEAHRKESMDRKIIELSKVTKKPKVDVGEVIKKSIEQVKENRYTSLYGKPNRDKAGKEVSNGTLS